jgi:CRP-like cAMP-binding protein
MPSIPPRLRRIADVHLVSGLAAPRARRLICIERPQLLDSLSLSECAEVVSCAQHKYFRPKETVYGHDDDVGAIALLVHGRVKTVCLNAPESQVVLRIEEPGDLIGEPGLTSSGPHSGFEVRALEPCQVLTWEAQAFDAVCGRFPRLIYNTMQILDDRLRIMEERFLELATESADSRLARTLIRLLEQKGLSACRPAKINFSNLELAQMTGMSPFTVNRRLSSWQQREIVKTHRNAIYVLNLDGLIDIAGTTRSDRSTATGSGTASPSGVNLRLDCQTAAGR